MNRSFAPYFLAGVLVTVFAGNTQAQNSGKINIVTTAVPFLRISPDARAGGMGDAGIATSADANSGFWNLAKTPFAPARAAISANYNPWLKAVAKDIYFATLSGYRQIKEGQALSAGIRFFSMGEAQFTDMEGNTLQRYRPQEFSVEAGYARKLGERLGMGVNFRYIRSSLANGVVNDQTYKAGTSFAADISLFHNGVNSEGRGLNWGINISNLGAKIAYTDIAGDRNFIPANLGAGIAYTTVLNDNSTLCFALDANRKLVPGLSMSGNASEDSASLAKYKRYGVVESWFQHNNDYAASIGAEYAYNNAFFVRTGYYYEGKNQGNRQYATAGLGIKSGFAAINFSYLIPTGSDAAISPLSNTIRFSLLFELGAAK